MLNAKHLLTLCATMIYYVYRAVVQDEATSKTTYPKLMGMDGAKKEARRQVILSHRTIVNHRFYEYHTAIFGIVFVDWYSPDELVFFPRLPCL